MRWAGKRSNAVAMNPEEEKVTKPDGESAERDSVFTAASRAFIVLLRITGLSAGPGWASHLLAVTLFSLQTWINFYSIYTSVNTFSQRLNQGERFFTAFVKGSFMGIPNAAFWLTLSVALVYGRLRYPTLLARVDDVLRDVEKAPELAPQRRKKNRIGEYVWALLAFFVTVYYWAKLKSISEFCGTSTTGCVMWLFNELVCFGYVSLCVHLVAIKFIFAGHLIASGYQAVNSGLEAMADGSRPADINSLRRLGELQRRLTEVFSLLTLDMTAELISVMLCGVFMHINTMTYLVQENGITVSSISGIIYFHLRYLPMVVVTLAGPCETCHLMMTRLIRCRGLLLRLERQRRPQLTAEVTLLQGSVAHDLDTLGGLGLYQLRRSTLLSIFSTILTYVIVVAQFQLSETGSNGEFGLGIGNTTEG